MQLRGLSIKDVRTQGKGGICPVRSFCGQRGRGPISRDFVRTFLYGQPLAKKYSNIDLCLNLKMKQNVFEMH